MIRGDRQRGDWLGWSRELPSGSRPSRPHLRVVPLRLPISGFSLLELLTVLVIIAILAVLVTPALSSMSSSLRIAQTSDGVLGQFSVARQRAMAFNRTVEVRLYQMPALGANLAGYRAIWVVDPGNGTTPSASAQLPYRFPDGIGIGENPALSSVMQAASGLTTTTDATLSFPALGSGLTYLPIQFYANGSTNLPITIPTATPWFFTFYQMRQTADRTLISPPNNYATVQIIPKTGDVHIYRP